MTFFAVSRFAALACAGWIIPAVIGQDQPPAEMKHLRISMPEGGAVSVTAAGMERDLSSARASAILRLRGNVEIRTPSRLPGRYTVVRADEAEYHEDTGEIEARGNVRVKLDAGR